MGPRRNTPTEAACCERLQRVFALLSQKVARAAFERARYRGYHCHEFHPRAFQHPRYRGAYHTATWMLRETRFRGAEYVTRILLTNLAPSTMRRVLRSVSKADRAQLQRLLTVS